MELGKIKGIALEQGKELINLVSSMALTSLEAGASELFDKAINAKGVADKAEKELRAINKRIEDSKALETTRNETIQNQKKELQESTKYVADEKAKDKQELAKFKQDTEEEKKKIITEKEAAISGKEALLISLKKQEDELNANINKLKTTWASISGAIG